MNAHCLVTNSVEWRWRESREQLRSLLTGRRRPLMDLPMMREFADQPTATQIFAPDPGRNLLYVRPDLHGDEWIYRDEKAFRRRMRKTARVAL